MLARRQNVATGLLGGLAGILRKRLALSGWWQAQDGFSGAVRGVCAVWTGSLSGAFGSLLAFGAVGGFSAARHVGGRTVETRCTRLSESHTHLPLDGIAATMPASSERFLRANGCVLRGGHLVAERQVLHED